MYFPPILHYLFYYFKHIGKHMMKCESVGTENMYNFAKGTIKTIKYQI